MKKFLKILRGIRDGLIILGIPTIGYYAYQLHLEQINTKEQQIELLNTRISTMEDLQVENMWEKYQSLKQFSHEQVTDLSNRLSKEAFIADSLRDYLKGPVWQDTNRVSFTIQETRIILEEAAKKQICDSLVILLEQQVARREQYADGLHQRIEELFDLNGRLFKELDKVSKILEDCANEP